MQVEVDALPPDVLRELFMIDLERLFDTSVFDSSRNRETADRQQLNRITEERFI
jgi:hypothetical protein